MKFSLSEEQTQIRELANKILQEQVTEERLRELDQCEVGQRFDRQVWQQLASAGLLGIAIDEAYGGMGFDFLALSLLLEEIGRSVAALPAVAVLAGAGTLIQQFGSEAQKQSLLPKIVSGESLVTVGFSEVLNPSTISSVITTASASGAGYQVSGVKHYVPFAAEAEKIVISALAATEPVLLLVDPKQAGVTLTPVITTNAEPQYKLELDNVQVDSANVLGEGLSSADFTAATQYAVNCLTAAYCSVQLGATDAATRMTAKYTGERKQFNVAIASFQAVAHRAADAYIDVECLRLCSQQAAALLSEPSPDESAQRVINDSVTMAKIWAGDAGHRVSYSAQQLHGGTGVDRDYPLWRYCMLMRQMEFAMGCTQQHLTDLGDRIAEYSVPMA